MKLSNHSIFQKLQVSINTFIFGLLLVAIRFDIFNSFACKLSFKYCLSTMHQVPFLESEMLALNPSPKPFSNTVQNNLYRLLQFII